MTVQELIDALVALDAPDARVTINEEGDGYYGDLVHVDTLMVYPSESVLTLLARGREVLSDAHFVTGVLTDGQVFVANDGHHALVLADKDRYLVSVTLDDGLQSHTTSATVTDWNTGWEA